VRLPGGRSHPWHETGEGGVLPSLLEAIDSGALEVSWALKVDTLTAVMMLLNPKKPPQPSRKRLIGTALGSSRATTLPRL